MFSLLSGLGAPKIKQVSQVRPARPDPKVQQAKNKIEAQIRQVENLLSKVGTHSEYTPFLQCLGRRLNDISIVCNEPTTPISKVLQMYSQAQAAAKKDASLKDKDARRAVVEQKQSDRKAETVARKEARKQKRLGTGKVISIEPKEEAAVAKIDATIEAQIKSTDRQIAETKKKIVEVKAKAIRLKAKPARRPARAMAGMGGLGLMIGGKDYDCNKKKNAIICSLATEFSTVSQATYDQMTGLIQELVEKQAQLESLLAELTALVATLPTSEQISATILETLPAPVDAEEIGQAVSTAITESLSTVMQPQYPSGGGGYIDPTSGQLYYPQTQPGIQTISDTPTMTDDVFGGGQEIVPTTSQPAFYSEPVTGRATVFLDTETEPEQSGGLGPLPNLEDLLNDFGPIGPQEDNGLLGLSCAGKQCSC